MSRARMMALSSLAVVLATFLAVAVLQTRTALPVAGKQPKHTLVVVSIDGLRHDYLDDTTHTIPTLRRLRSEGAHARSVKSVWPSVTYPAHTTLMTGVVPARHGILNNVVFDPFEKNEGGWYWYARDLQVPTLWDAAADAGIVVGNVTWPVTVGARIRYNLPQYWRSRSAEDEKLLEQLSTPGLFAEVAKENAPPGEHRTDRARADAAVTILRSKRPGLVLVYLTDLDTAQHAHGPMSPQAWTELERIDAFVADILAEASKMPRLSVAIVSDHGFVQVDTDVRPNVALREANLLTTKPRAGRTEEALDTYEAVTWKAGGSAAIMGKNGRTEPTVGKVKALFTKLAADPANHIAEVLDGADVERQGGFPGAIVVLQAAKGTTFTQSFEAPLVAPSQYHGTHGQRPDLPEMGASLIFWGSGVRPGDLGEVDMLDVAPTLAALLGVALPSAQGKVLRAALVP